MAKKIETNADKLRKGETQKSSKRNKSWVTYPIREKMERERDFLDL